MVELAAQGADGWYRRGFGGDTANTAVYLARAGLAVSYVSALGDDALSDEIITALAAEGIDTATVHRTPGRQSGLYLIDNDAHGERRFRYWRGEAPVRQLFDTPCNLPPPEVFYFSGITLSVMRSGHANLLALLTRFREAGCRVVFDSNYRPALWRDAAEARTHIDAVLPFCHTALPTLADEVALWGTPDAAACRDRYREKGVGEIVIKGDGLTAYACCGETQAERQAVPVTAVDTTGAGDAFNAGYLAARLAGASLEVALARAQALAAEVVQHHGAIIPRDAMPHTGNTGR